MSLSGRIVPRASGGEGYGPVCAAGKGPCGALNRNPEGELVEEMHELSVTEGLIQVVSDEVKKKTFPG
jgi:hypothetical protein